MRAVLLMQLFVNSCSSYTLCSLSLCLSLSTHAGSTARSTHQGGSTAGTVARAAAAQAIMQRGGHQVGSTNTLSTYETKHLRHEKFAGVCMHAHQVSTHACAHTLYMHEEMKMRKRVHAYTHACARCRWKVGRHHLNKKAWLFC